MLSKILILLPILFYILEIRLVNGKSFKEVKLCVMPSPLQVLGTRRAITPSSGLFLATPLKSLLEPRISPNKGRIAS